MSGSDGWRLKLLVSSAVGLGLSGCAVGEGHEGFPFDEAGLTDGAASTADGGAGSTGVIPSQDASTGGATGDDGDTEDRAAAECGNGVVEDGETCDGDAFPESLSCDALGFGGGVPLCRDDCQSYSGETCFTCGNGEIEGPESCETDGVPQGVTCESEGFTEGAIDCDTSTCQLITTDCSLCGNDTVEGAELCDGADLGGDSCSSIGFSAGDLACASATCRYDASACSGGAWFDDFESGTLGPAYTTSALGAFTVTGTTPISGSSSAQSGDINDSQNTELTLTTVFSEAGTVSFAQRVSSESGWDYLTFSIDGAQQGTWSGEASSSETYNVAAGEHTLQWRYEKDGSLDGGSDTAWVDDINLVGGVAF